MQRQELSGKLFRGLILLAVVNETSVLLQKTDIIFHPLLKAFP